MSKVDEMQMTEDDKVKNRPGTIKHEWVISPGAKIVLRTLTYIYTGRVVALNEHWVELDQACWIAETARYGEFLEKGSIVECEPYPHEGRCQIRLDHVTDASPWVTALPRTAQ